MGFLQKTTARLAWKLYAASIYKQSIDGDPYITDKITKIFHDAATKHKETLFKQLFNKEIEVVQAGAFKGVSLINEGNWNEANLMTMLLGQYERQLQDRLIGLTEINFKNIIVIGCAEGFFSIGLARLFPKSKIISVDIDKTTLEICRRNSDANGCLDRSDFLTSIDQESLGTYLNNGEQNFVFSDCEGFEFTLFTADFIRKFPQTTYMCEIHDFTEHRDIIEGKKESFLGEFKPTHVVEVIRDEPRNARETGLLDHLTASEQWLALDEARARGMEWLLATPSVKS